MAALVLAEHDNKNLKSETAKVISAAKALGGPVLVLVAGENAGGVATAAAKLAGVDTVLHADSPLYGKGLAEPLAALLVSLKDRFDALLAPSTASGKNVLPRVAALLDVMQISDVLEVQSADTFVRPIYAGNALETVKSKDAKKVMTVRVTAFAAVDATSGTAKIETVAAAADPGLSRFVGEALSKSERPELSAARIVVSGGRGLQSGENFKMLETLADKLGAAIGASRAAVDAGYVPNDYQVGQTGKVVAPELYIAIGISGAIQHLAGMKDSKIIVAINKDEEAPIFQIADFGLVADLFKAVPELEQELAKRGK